MTGDMTYCNSRCRFRARCARHYTHHVTGEPGVALWMAEFRTAGRLDKPCPYYIKKREIEEV